jgi:hypothetical protein
LTILTLNFLPTFGQKFKESFDRITNILKADNSSKRLIQKLDSLKSKNYMSSLFERDLDFEYRHQRIILGLNSYNYQIDLLKKNDTIYAKTVKQYTNVFNTDSTTLSFYSKIDTSLCSTFLNKRNQFYKSKKSISDLISGISKTEEFAFYCGDGSPITEMGREISNYVKEENTDELTNMLMSFCVETQAFGVSGFEMLVRQDYALPSDINKLIRHIKNRDSETIICSGCLSGLVEKIYTKKKKNKKISTR